MTKSSACATRQKQTKTPTAKQKKKSINLNHADSLIFQTEKQLKEFGDKASLPIRRNLSKRLLGKLKAAHASQDLSAIDEATKVLNELWNAASQQM